MKRLFLLCALFTATAYADVVPWMTTTFSDPANFFAFQLNGESPNGSQAFVMNVTLTVGKFVSLINTPSFSEDSAPLKVNMAGTITNTVTGTINHFSTKGLPGGGVIYEAWAAPNPPEQFYDYHYTIIGNWSDSGWASAISGFLDETVIPKGDPVNTQIRFSTVTPEPSTLLMLGSGLVSAYSVFRLRRSRATASKDAS